MAPEQSEDSPKRDGAGPPEVSPAQRKRLQQCFEHANTKMSQEDYSYANELFTQCVVGDPANFIYLQSFLGNLKKKYKNNKKGSKLAFPKRGPVKKAASQGNWPGVIKAGVEVLKSNPWDVPSLSAMANAANEMGCHDVRMAYLKTALEANPKDAGVNKLCAKALEDVRDYDQAIVCWHRVQQAQPGNDEAEREIARLAVEKTIHKGGYEDPDRASSSLSESGQSSKAAQSPKHAEMSPEQQLEKDIERHPKDIAKYFELAELHISRERYDRAEEVLSRAFEATDGDPNVQERWDDTQLRHIRQQLSKAEGEAQESGTDEAKQKCQEIRKELNAKELQIHQNRVKRFPTNLSFRYDLGVRLQMNGMHNEAIAEYQQARNDPRRKGACMLALGQCFQQIKQYRLAMSHYEEAIQEIPDRDSDNKKLSLYLAGRLAMGLKSLDVAERYLSTLAGLDFSYRNVSELLDKINKLRKEEGQED